MRAILGVLALTLAPHSARAVEAPGRQLQSLDADWRFLRADAPGAERPDFDDHGWSAVTLPHTFNGVDGERGEPVYRGPAWYRRTLELAAGPNGRRAYLQVDGAYLVAEVWVNGKRAGRHEGGFAGFRFDVTDLLRPGRNLVAVRVDSAKQTDVAPLGGDFTPSGGLYRDVHLLWTAPVHVDALDDGGAGVYAQAEAVSTRSAGLKITTRLRNDRATPARLTLRTRVLDARGEPVAEASSTVGLAPGAGLAVIQAATLDHPHLWDGRKDPYLYRVVAEVADAQAPEAGPVDRVEVPLGVRSFAMDPRRGFLLNGRPYPVHGVDYFHSGRPGRGLAVGEAEIDEDFSILKALGVTGLRLVHFQHPQRAYDDADRAGLVVWTEIPLNSAFNGDAAFAANLDQQLRELIRQNFNHPSVVAWGLGNELYKSDAVSSRVLDGAQKTARAEDPTRPTTYADCCHAEDDAQAEHTDLIGFNRYFGWYDGEVEQFGPWLAATHARLPERPVAISEYGTGASAFQQEDPPRRPKPYSHWHPEQYQALWHERAWRQMRDQTWLWGTFVWVGFDVISAGRDEGDRKGINDKGLVTLDRKTFKDAFYWYQANWSETPMVHITSPRDTPRTVQKVEVKVYANTAAVDLRLNGRDLGEKAVVDHVAIWPVVLKAGPNRIEARAVGVTARDAAAWTYSPAGPAR